MFNDQKCPRCGEKNAKMAVKCSYCGLIFERLKWATNKAGKKMLHLGKKNKVVYTTKLPSDLKMYKILLMCIFLGLFGGHCFYVGRFKKGILMLCFGIVFIIGAILSMNNLIPVSIGTFIYIIVGALGIMWVFDIFNICIKKFKVPVSIELVEEKWVLLLWE